MKNRQSCTAVRSWIKPLLLIALAALVTTGCKESSSSSGGAGIPAPPSAGGIPGGGMPSPPSPPGGSPGGSGSPDGGSGSPSGGSSSPSGDSGDGDSGDGDGSSGEVGAVPPPPSEAGDGSAGDHGIGTVGEAGSGEDGDGDLFGECGDTGALPGGIGGMGQDGECLGGGGESASESDSEASADGDSGGGGAGRVGEFPEESDAERAARLGQELDDSIGGFDGVLMEEQRDIQSVGRNMEGFGGGESGSAGGISLGEQEAGRTGIAVANTGITRQSPIDGMSEEEIRERTPEDVPVMVDDDIIAKQLREAALAEDDPALRERLWEEYRKYKGI